MKVTSGTGSTESSTCRSRREHGVMPTHNGTALVGLASCLARELALKWGTIRWPAEVEPGKRHGGLCSAEKSPPCRYPSSRIRQIIPEGRCDPSVRDRGVNVQYLSPRPIFIIEAVSKPRTSRFRRHSISSARAPSAPRTRVESHGRSCSTDSSISPLRARSILSTHVYFHAVSRAEACDHNLTASAQVASALLSSSARCSIGLAAAVVKGCCF
jgi:hypothetical protein